jgi:hypothetical protein
MILLALPGKLHPAADGVVVEVSVYSALESGNVTLTALPGFNASQALISAAGAPFSAVVAPGGPATAPLRPAGTPRRARLD